MKKQYISPLIDFAAGETAEALLQGHSYDFVDAKQSSGDGFFDDDEDDDYIHNRNMWED